MRIRPLAAVLLVSLPLLVLSCIHGTLSWSLDGRRFVFAGLQEEDRGQSDRGGLYVFDLDEKAVTRPQVTDVRLSTPLFLDDERILVVAPSTADAPTLVMSTVERSTRRRRPLCMLRLRGPAPEEDVETAAGMIVPSASEDRTRVAFHLVQPHAPPAVVVLDLLEQTLTVLPEVGLFPVLTPDGGKVVFLATPDEGRSVRVAGERVTHPLKGVIDLSGAVKEDFGYGEPRISGLAVHDLATHETTLAVRWKGKLDAAAFAASRDARRYALAGKRGVVLFDLETGKGKEIVPDEQLSRITFDRDDRTLLAVCEGRTDEKLRGALVRVGEDGGIGRVFGGPHTLPIVAFGLAPDRRTFATVHAHPRVRDPLAVIHDLSTGAPTAVLLGELDPATELIARWGDLLRGAGEEELGAFDLAFKDVARRVDEEVPPDDERRSEFAQRMQRARDGRFGGR